MRVKKSWLWLLAASIILSLALPLALGGLGQFKLLDRLSWWAALLFTLLMMVSWWFNSWRIRMLIRVGGHRMSWREAVLTTASAEFAGVTTPGGVVMLVVRGAAAIVWNLGRYYRRICIGIGRQMGKAPRLARYRYRLARAPVQFVRCLRLLQKMSWPQYVALFLITLGYWLPRYLLLFLIILLVGQAVPLSYLFLVQGALNLGSQILLMPGGGGTVEAGYAAFISPYLDRETLAFTLLVWRPYTFS